MNFVLGIEELRFRNDLAGRLFLENVVLVFLLCKLGKRSTSSKRQF